MDSIVVSLRAIRDNTGIDRKLGKVRGAALEVVDALQLQMLRLEAQLVDLKLQLLVEKVLP
jgi:hypothetical protein